MEQPITKKQYIKKLKNINIKTIKKSIKEKEHKNKQPYIKPSFIICFDD